MVQPEFNYGSHGSHKVFVSPEALPAETMELDIPGGTHCFLGVQLFSGAGSDATNRTDPLRVLAGTGQFTVEVMTINSMQWEAVPGGPFDATALETLSVAAPLVAVRVTPAGASGFTYYRVVATTHIS